MDLILQRRLLFGHQVTGDPPGQVKTGLSADCCKETSQFSGLLDIPVRPDEIQMQMQHTVTVTKVVRVMQSQAMWDFKTRVLKGIPLHTVLL